MTRTHRFLRAYSALRRWKKTASRTLGGQARACSSRPRADVWGDYNTNIFSGKYIRIGFNRQYYQQSTYSAVQMFQQIPGRAKQADIDAKYTDLLVLKNDIRIRTECVARYTEGTSSAPRNMKCLRWDARLRYGYRANGVCVCIVFISPSLTVYSTPKRYHAVYPKKHLSIERRRTHRQSSTALLPHRSRTSHAVILSRQERRISADTPHYRSSPFIVGNWAIDHRVPTGSTRQGAKKDTRAAALKKKTMHATV